MKKLLIALTATLLLASCSQHTSCPAYKGSQPNTQKGYFK